MSQINEIRDYLSRLQAGEFPNREHTTHLMELLTMMKFGLGSYAETRETHYLFDGLRSEILFADGKTYVIEIRERK